MQVTPDLIRKTAQLAQLSFEEEELVKLVPRFESFLRFADKMQEVQDSGRYQDRSLMIMDGKRSLTVPPLLACRWLLQVMLRSQHPSLL